MISQFVISSWQAAPLQEIGILRTASNGLPARLSAPQPGLKLLIIAQMGAQAFPEFAVIGDGEMKEFVDDDVVAKFAVQIEQLVVET